MFITLLHNLGAIGVEDGNSVDFRTEHLEGDQLPDLEVVAHGKWCPAIVNRCSTIMVDDGHNPVAASVRLEDDLFKDGS